jgi:hypothetical protein
LDARNEKASGNGDQALQDHLARSCARFLSNPERPNILEGKAIVFEGPEDYCHRIEDPSLGVEE